MKKTNGFKDYIGMLGRQEDSTGTEPKYRKRQQTFFAIALLVLWLLVFLAIHYRFIANPK